MGIPMLGYAWPAAWITFVPVALVEGLMARRVLGLRTGQALKLSLAANGWSTLAGIPVAWLGLVVLQMLTDAVLALANLGATPALMWALAPLHAAWLPPVRATWIVSAAGAFLCVPFFLMSVWIEGKVAARYASPRAATRWARRANMVTYGAITSALIATTLLELV